MFLPFVIKKKNRGISLIESVVAISIFALVIFSITYLLVSFYRYNAHGFQQTAAIDSAGRGIEPTINDIREMDFSDDGAYPIISASTSTFSFYSDIDADSGIEKVRLFLEGTTLKKGVTKSAGDPPIYTGQPETIFILSRDVRNITLGNDVFLYFDENGAAVSDLTKIFDIAFVKMNVTVNVNPALSPNDFTLRASTAFRNIKPAIATTTNQNLLNGLIGHWAFDETSGTVASDSSGSNNDGTLVGGPTWTTVGRVNGALLFDGVNDRVTVPDAPGLDLSSVPFSFGAWFNAYSNGSSGSGTILSKSRSSAGNGDYSYVLRVAGSGYTQIMLSLAGVGCSQGPWSGVIPNFLNNWHHIMVVADTNTIYWYIDGVPAGTEVRSACTYFDGTDDLHIGSVFDSVYAFDGIIDDVRIYNRDLAASEVLQLYQLGGI